MKITIRLTYSDYVHLEVDDNTSDEELLKLGLAEADKQKYGLDFDDGAVFRDGIDDATGDVLEF